MPHFNTALNHQHALAVRRCITSHHIANVGNQVGLRQVAAPIDTSEVKIQFVRTAHPIAEHRHFAVHQQFDGLLQVERAQVAWLATKMVCDLHDCGKPKSRQTCQFPDLDFVHVVVTAQQQQPHLRLDDLAGVVQRVSGQHQ